MTSNEATKLVFVGAGVTAAVVVASTKDEDARFKALWAIGLLTVGLAAVADFAPQLAGPFAVLIAVAAVARHPGSLGSRLGFGPAAAAPRPSGAAGRGGATTSPPSQGRGGSGGGGGAW